MNKQEQLRELYITRRAINKMIWDLEDTPTKNKYLEQANKMWEEAAHSFIQ